MAAFGQRFRQVEGPVRADRRPMLRPGTVIGSEFDMLILQGLANRRSWPSAARYDRLLCRSL